MSPSNVSTTHLAVPESNRYFPSFSLRSRKSEFSLSQLKTTQEQAPEPPKLAKRESRLGLRRMFSRSKLKPEDSAPPPVPPVPVYTERTSLGASRSTVYLNQPNPSETALSVMSGSAAAASDTNLPGTSRTFGSIGRGSRRSFMPRPLLGGKSAADELEIPALYSAYHQSIRQATLQAPTISGDAVLSLQEAPSSQPQDGDVQDDTSRLTKRSKDKAKKGDDKSSPFEWTSKIYLLTTSANLLQYTADGHYERVPERVLKLTANSAAFVTDCIPGKHWVLRISADVLTTLTPDPASMVDHRSLFSKEPNRRASNFLMVFDNADDMDGWIVAVRSEILKLKDAETQDTVGERQIRERASQRTLTARDLSRLESSETVQCYPTSERKQSTAAITVSDYDKTNEQCLDDVSVTNSVVSQEGQQLETHRTLTWTASLRERQTTSSLCRRMTLLEKPTKNSMHYRLILGKTAVAQVSSLLRKKAHAQAAAIRQHHLHHLAHLHLQHLSLLSQPRQALPTRHWASASRSQYVAACLRLSSRCRLRALAPHE
ncbi:hypothetical protein VHEMI03522 [[Torrubiella] hemipterigena]|uniref:PH domain-containing protein n=1 Tax=[Torrubiella] hemipterigena TaxID=1531966 RepID=A0A0A1TDN3_9HYPO|nr:hypothetical protein VHEMI03522 [[Torrubiella] hemipterigena]